MSESRCGIALSSDHARLRYTMLFYARHDDDDGGGGNDDVALTCTHAHDVHQRVNGHGSTPDISPNYTCMHNRHEKSQQDR